MNIMLAFIAMRIARITRQSDGKKRSTGTRPYFAVIAFTKCVSLNTQHAIITARIAEVHLIRNARHMIIIILKKNYRVNTVVSRHACKKRHRKYWRASRYAGRRSDAARYNSSGPSMIGSDIDFFHELRPVFRGSPYPKGESAYL